jgi:hypothetical protein
MSSLAFACFVLFECFLDCDSLELGFLFGFFPFDRLVLCEVLNIFWVVVGFVGLRFGCRVKFLYGFG